MSTNKTRLDLVFLEILRKLIITRHDVIVIDKLNFLLHNVNANLDDLRCTTLSN